LNTTIIGIDFATQPRDIGLALGHFNERTTTILRVTTRLKTMDDVVNTTVGWMPSGGQTLIALDAPLGWPKEMSSALVGHKAGEQLGTTANSMFHRETDSVVRDLTGRLPLEVGANLIARTAHAALEFLRQVEDRTHQPIRLAWNPPSRFGLLVIEVYPAATMHAHRIHLVGKPSYKKGKGGWQGVLGTIVERLQEGKELRLPDDVKDFIVNDDALDAMICVLAGVDFLQENAVPPRDDQLETARREGWIWVRKPIQPPAHLRDGKPS